MLKLVDQEGIYLCKVLRLQTDIQDGNFFEFILPTKRFDASKKEKLLWIVKAFFFSCVFVFFPGGRWNREGPDDHHPLLHRHSEDRGWCVSQGLLFAFATMSHLHC